MFCPCGIVLNFKLRLAVTFAFLSKKEHVRHVIQAWWRMRSTSVWVAQALSRRYSISLDYQYPHFFTSSMNFELVHSDSQFSIHHLYQILENIYKIEAITTFVNAVLSITVTRRDNFQTEHHVNMECQDFYMNVASGLKQE